MGRGDSALRYIGRQPESLGTMVEAMAVIKGLVAGEEVDYQGRKLSIPWLDEGWDLPMWVAAISWPGISRRQAAGTGSASTGGRRSGGSVRP